MPNNPSECEPRPAPRSMRQRLLWSAAAAAVFVTISMPASAQQSLLCSTIPLFCGPAPVPAPGDVPGALRSSDVLPGTAPAPAVEVPPAVLDPKPRSLKGRYVPKPDTLSFYVADEDAAVRLGKALFWDMQVGSDGKTACASCHFHAGADTRARNQVSPGLTRQSSLTAFNPDATFQLGGPNYTAKLSDFPFHKLKDPHDRDSTVLRSINDTFSSQGVFRERFESASRGATADRRTPQPDGIFHIGDTSTRRVEPRNSPTVINAVFNFRNFWDGRAQYLFNGVNPFGGRDPDAHVYKTGGTWNGSGPTLSALRCGREWAEHCVLPPGVTTRVWYGRGDKWVWKNHVSGAVACSNSTFSKDPAPGVVKLCMYEPNFEPPAEAPSCAQDWGTCKLPAGLTTTVWYGAKTSWRAKTGMSGSFQCEPSTFGGDPFVGVVKLCRYETTPNTGMSAVKIRLNKASLASQASGPPLSEFEMSAGGRTFMDLGKRVLGARPLWLQRVAAGDSVLGPLASAPTGLNVATYEDMVRKAFKPEWWNGTQVVQVDASGARKVLPPQTSLAANQYTHMQANFSMLFSLALQMYQATLVSDDSPFDRHLSGTPSLTAAQLQGMSVFYGKGKCANCHGGPEFTNATFAYVVGRREAMSRMTMGNGGKAVYDEGYYNIGVRRTLEDILNGGVDPKRNPISLTGLLQKVGPKQFQEQIGIRPNLKIGERERIAVNGASKTPGLRNVELTAPYFHTGGAATLRQVVEFYNRGGNFARENMADLDSDIRPLGLTEDEIRSLVDFMKSLTDDRVRFSAAPFDHPQLMVPNGHLGDTSAVVDDGVGRAEDVMLTIPATNAAGYTTNKDATPANFLGTAASGSPWVRLQWVGGNGKKCVAMNGSLQRLSMQDCKQGSAQQEFRVVPGVNGGFTLEARHAYLQVVGLEVPHTNGGQLRMQVPRRDHLAQLWNVQESNDGVRLYNQAVQRCMVPDASDFLAARDCGEFNPGLKGVDAAGFRLIR